MDGHDKPPNAVLWDWKIMVWSKFVTLKWKKNCAARNKIRNKYSEKITEIKHGYTNLIFPQAMSVPLTGISPWFLDPWRAISDLTVCSSLCLTNDTCLFSQFLCNVFSIWFWNSREIFNGEKNCFHKRKIWKQQLHPQEKQLPLSPEIMWQFLLDRANVHCSQGTRTQNCCYLSVTKPKYSDLQKRQLSKRVDSLLCSWGYNLQWDRTDFSLKATQGGTWNLTAHIHFCVSGS